MKSPVLFAALLLQASSVMAGAWVIQPQPNGAIRMLHEGIGDASGADTLTVRQPAHKSLTLLVSPAGGGRCEGGDLVLGTLHFPLQLFMQERPVVCGDLVQFSAQPNETRVGVRAVNRSVKGERSFSEFGAFPRVQVGNISFNVEGDSDGENYPIYLDLTALHTEAVTIQASFDKPALSMGLVGELNDATANARLKIAKTSQSGDEALPYILTFESTQQRDNHYQLRASKGAMSIPYRISIDGKEIAPGFQYRGTIPSGTATVDWVDIQFALSGKSTRGLAAGTRLIDTLTAVITPNS
ncbi:hypothetical protein [Hafnia alvei]|uniref:Uncharacterized protein n=1 Tax=Hafnia alvei TaxID=569 RepID=A0A1C6YW42_HAFAL|nr:hypothetical protein [Hafnia alvei]NLS56124.1 hypothetical protein [Hafnia alvei]SCM51098.1 hypothetical protein BN1044_00551 [Hafnia alvei]